MNWKPIFFFKPLDFMLDLSFSFKQNLMHLVWAACKRVLISYLSLDTNHYMLTVVKVKLNHCTA